MRIRLAIVALACVLSLFSPMVSAQDAGASAVDGGPLRFVLTHEAWIDESFTGRVYVLLSRSDRREPRFGPSVFRPEPFFATDVTDWTAGEPLIIDASSLGHPTTLDELASGTWTAQAVMRAPTGRTIGEGPGTGYSLPLTRELDAASTGDVSLHIEKMVGTPATEDSLRIRHVEIRSEMLSAFHGREVKMRAAAILPSDFRGVKGVKYPTMYWIGGFGSDHTSAPGIQRVYDATGNNQRFIRIVLDPLCYGGNHVFCDSAANGPVGTALVEEFIPFLEHVLPLDARPQARLLGGHSSGGWASLWLQVSHPDFFGGVWSFAPDPVDFRDFQRINLYEPGANMYRDADGERRPIARRGDTPMLWYDDFAAFEVVYGEGGQLRSFEWTFSPLGPDGLPLPLYDRETGAVNTEVAESWRAYDIRQKIEREWDVIGPKLAGKIHIFGGGKDTFYLEGALRLLDESLKSLGSDAVIEIFEDADHGNFATTELRTRVDAEMLEASGSSSEPRP